MINSGGSGIREPRMRDPAPLDPGVQAPEPFLPQTQESAPPASSLRPRSPKFLRESDSQPPFPIMAKNFLHPDLDIQGLSSIVKKTPHFLESYAPNRRITPLSFLYSSLGSFSQSNSDFQSKSS